MALIERDVREKIVLVGVTLPPDTAEDTGAGLDELSLLVDTAGADEVGRIVQRRRAPDPPTYVGKGKAEELRELALETDCDTVVFDNELSPGQQRNLEKLLGRTAIDRTAVSSNYSLTLTRPVGQRYQFAMTVGASQIGATPASGGVPAQEATGLNLAWQAQLYGSSLWREGDFSVLSAAYSDTETGKIVSLGITSRMPIGGAWRLGPRLTIDHRQLASDGSKELSFVPSALLDYQRGRNLLQFEVGGQIGKRDNQVQTQNTKRYYVSLAYRIGF